LRAAIIGGQFGEKRLCGGRGGRGKDVLMRLQGFFLVLKQWQKLFQKIQIRFD